LTGIASAEHPRKIRLDASLRDVDPGQLSRRKVPAGKINLDLSVEAGIPAGRIGGIKPDAVSAQATVRIHPSRMSGVSIDQGAWAAFL
jgi:hypothetical protein